MALDYFALGALFFVFITLFYGVIVIHDIPYEIAHRRNHPHQDAIHVAGWVSLFTLHVIWPFLWIWATLYREDRGWGFQTASDRGAASQPGTDSARQGEPERLDEEIKALREEVATLRNRLAVLEAGAGTE